MVEKIQTKTWLRKSVKLIRLWPYCKGKEKRRRKSWISGMRGNIATDLTSLNKEGIAWTTMQTNVRLRWSGWIPFKTTKLDQEEIESLSIPIFLQTFFLNMHFNYLLKAGHGVSENWRKETFSVHFMSLWVKVGPPCFCLSSWLWGPPDVLSSKDPCVCLKALSAVIHCYYIGALLMWQ